MRPLRVVVDTRADQAPLGQVDCIATVRVPEQHHDIGIKDGLEGRPGRSPRIDDDQRRPTHGHAPEIPHGAVADQPGELGARTDVE